MVYVGRHHGSLPGKDWRDEIEQVDPTLESVLRGREEPWAIGFAAIPGTLGRKLDDLPPETILCVEYRSDAAIDVLQNVGDVGDPHREGGAFVVTAGDGGSAKSRSLAEIGFQLGRQGAPGLR